MRTTLMIAAALALPLAALAQGVIQSRSGLGDAAHPTKTTNNAAPAGSINAATGPQSRPAYPSGSSTPNPGAAFVRTTPKPATGALARPPGAIGTTTVTGGAARATPSAGVGEAAAPPK